MKVAIIGGGLVGRLAAWAAMQSGHSPTIFDKQLYATTPRGFVYLHDPCGLPLKKETIHVIEQGNANEYRDKVYGDDASHVEDVSFGKFAGEQYGYDPAELLNILNGMQHGMEDLRGFKDLREILQLRDEYERLVFTLQLDTFVPGYWPSIRAAVRIFKLDDGEVLPNFCVYNSNPDIPWHRAGSMFGYAFYEYPGIVGVDTNQRIEIKKVVPCGSTLPVLDQVLFTGRFGAWNKSALSHESYYEVLHWLSQTRLS